MVIRDWGADLVEKSWKRIGGDITGKIGLRPLFWDCVIIVDEN